MALVRKSLSGKKKEQRRTLEHFTHSHVLTRASSDQNELVCNACHTSVPGVRYSCKQCKFNLHEYCADCPEYLNTYLHPNHQLELMWDGSESIKRDCGGRLRPCGVCGDQVKGLLYICSDGAEERKDDGQHFFFLHPLCSKFPSQMRHGIDEKHPLKFKSVPVIHNSVCAVCSTVVYASSWSYRCDPCGVNIHIECVTLPFEKPQYSPRSPMMHQRKGSQNMYQQNESPKKMYEERGLVHRSPVSPRYEGYDGTTTFTPTPRYNHHQYPPRDYYYPPSPRPYEPPPTYNNYPPQHAPPNNATTSSNTGGKKQGMAIASTAAGFMGKAAISLFLSSVFADI